MKKSSNTGRYLITIIAFFVLYTAASSSSIFDSDVEILQSDNKGVTLRYMVPEIAFGQFNSGSSGYAQLSIPRTASNNYRGEVNIPIKIVPLAVPPGFKASASVLQSEYESVDFKKLAPYFSVSSEDSLSGFLNSEKGLNPINPASNPYVSKTENIRGLNIATLAIPTAKYSSQQASLSVLKSITIRVDFTAENPLLPASPRSQGHLFERIFRKTVANYNEGRSWFEPRQSSDAITSAAASPFDSAGTWIRIELVSEGIYGFGWPQFNIVGINPLSVIPGQVRVFYGGGQELPLANSQPRPQLTEIPIKILGGDDGQFDNGDLIVFYADAVDSWSYSSQFGRYLRYRNHYTDKNVYWLTIDGSFSGEPRRIINVNGTPDGAFDVSIETYEAIAHREQEKEFWAPNGENVDYFEWYWGRDRNFATSIQLYDLVPGIESKVIVRHQSGSPSLIVNGGTPIAPQTYQTYSTYSTQSLVDGANNLALESVNSFYLDYFDVLYPRWLRVIDGNLLFSQPDTFGTIRYNLTQISGQYLLFDISDRNNPLEIVDGYQNGAALVFDDTVSQESHKRYYISSRDRLKSPGAVSLYQIDNLRNTSAPENRADEIIITYDTFIDAADQLAAHRLQAYGLATRVVKVSDIYNQFSFGLTDAVAIRDFLKFAYQNWPEPAPSYVLLFGDGHYDFRNYLGNNVRSFIPPFENTTRMTDEHFIYFGAEGYLDSDTNQAPDMLIGRVNARSAAEAQDFLNKTIDYDSNSDLGPWRNRIVVVADDNLHPAGGNFYTSETFHTTQAEDLANNHIPGKFEPVKLYLLEYLMGTGGEKPAARDALIGAMNQGALVVDWIGHGSANLWADEHVFRRIQDIPRLTNGRRTPLIFTASCSIGKFDIPNVESMAEEFIRSASGRAISVISATRDVLASPNAALNETVYDQVLNSDSAGIGEALYIAKFLRAGPSGVDYNDRYYMVFGDPAQILQYPKYDIRLTSSPDSLVALSVDSLSGEIVNNNGEIQSAFNGTVWVTVKDGSITRQVTLRDRFNTPLPEPNTYNFKAPGSTIFVGPAEVANGLFTSRFFIPKDISYGSRGAKIYAYSENGVIDALGVADSIAVSGSLPSIQDTTGPTVTLLVDGRPFVQGVTMVPSSFTLGAEIYDEHGINITGQLGHGIVVDIDEGDVYAGDITSNFSYNLGDYRSGRLEARLAELPLGDHILTFKVWDNFNNSTLITHRIEAVAVGNLRLSDVMNYPNPVKKDASSTAFQYCLSEDVDKVTIKIFTEAGKRIRTIDLISSDDTQMDCNQVSWDLLDADGDRLANGIYLYMISAEKTRTDGSKDKADASGKLVILR